MRTEASPRLHAAITLALCIGLLPAAGAATFVVDSAEDSGEGSLRAAIGLANATPGPHTIAIQVPGSAVTLSLGSPLPAITVNDLTIDGSASTGFRIDGQDQHRVFETAAGNQRLTLRGIELRRGRASSGGCVQIANRADAELLLDGVFFEACAAVRADGPALGGAVHMPTGASLEVIGSRFVGNSASGTGSGQRGGAIAAGAASVDLRDSRFQSNLVSGGGASDGRAGGAVSIAGTAVSIVFARGNRFSENGVSTGSAAFGGALEVNCAGCVVSMDSGYFGQNSAGLGGAIALRQGFSGAGLSATFANVTIERNLADGGGGMYLAQTGLDARNLSLQNNRATSGAHLRTGPGFALDRLSNSVFGRVDPAGGASSCQLAETVSAGGPLGGNLFTESASCGGLASSGASALASGVVATLDSAANLMPVLVFPAGSGVIDRGGRQLACTLSDARATERPIDGDGDGDPECDIGAFEHAASPLIFRNGFETAP
jgi:hypothetical protein